MGTTMSISLSEAATAVGMYKSSVLRAIKAGKISAAKDEHGEWRIEPAELHRVYAPVAEGDAKNGATRQDATAALQAQITGLREIGELLRAQLNDALEQRDKWQAQAERLALAAPEPEQRPQSWWTWLRSTG
jgi:hypothetical protein